MNIVEILKEASNILSRSGVSEPRREAASLLEFALKKDRTFLFAHPEYKPEDEEERRFRSFVERRSNREPFHYIAGVKEFYGLDFEVSPDVLIPRPETELLVENSIEILRELDKPSFCEVGLGSGCISVSILQNVKSATAVGLEISENALNIARRNAEKHHISDRFRLCFSDVFSALSDEKFGLIVSNPPYVPLADVADLQSEVRDFEPLSALTDGGNGLSIIERIIKAAPEFLTPNGFLLMEIGAGQEPAVKTMFDAEIWQGVDFILDFQVIPRVVLGRLGNFLRSTA